LDDPPGWKGDAKLAGRVEEIVDDARKASIIGLKAPAGPNHLFHADISEVSVVHLAGEPPDHLVIEAWHAGRGVTRSERR
jgi:hypothetical protein